MYSETDLDAAVAAGKLTPEAAAGLRAHAAELRASPAVDEEQFRLITGFNDIFVSIAAIMLLVAVGWLGGTIAPWTGAAAVAAASWGLAEYFTLRRRMALPSILLLASFVYAVFFAVLLLTFGSGRSWVGSDDFSTAQASLRTAAAALVATGAAVAHWRRFHVPITVAAGVGTLSMTVIGLLLWAAPAIRDYVLTLVFLAGIGTFALAMWWDMSDRERLTRRSDVAFWLHLSAAPMLVHPVFSSLGLLGRDDGNVGQAGLALLLYVGLGLVALAIDRRALLVSALVYVLVAMARLFDQLGSLNLSFAFTALIIGSALLLLSAFWHRTRAALVGQLPERLRARLPVTDRDRVATPVNA